MQILAGDIGGTKTRLAILSLIGPRIQVLVEKTYPSPAYPSFESLLDGFLQDYSDHRCDGACFGVAGPVQDNRCTTTNLPWQLDAGELAAALGLGPVWLLNDLEATAWGIAALGEEDFAELQAGALSSSGNRAVIAAGTGLGEAGMFWDGRHHRPFGSEGGHTDFSPNSELEIELWRFLCRRYQHLSWERVLSGPGLVNLYEFMREYHQATTPTWLVEEMSTGPAAAAISQAALEGRDELCHETLDLFVRLYGVEAGNQALKVMATGGVFVGGGIAPKILPALLEGGFLAGFLAKGRMRPLMEGIQVRIILNDRAALLGPGVFVAAREW